MNVERVQLARVFIIVLNIENISEVAVSAVMDALRHLLASR